MRNPNWTKDEILLAIDLYFRVGRKMPSENNPEVASLSMLLNNLGIHPKEKHGDNFRNPDSVAMKIGNIQFYDDHTPGGLPAGSKLDKQMWDEYGSKPEEVRLLAELIKSKRKEVKLEDFINTESDEEFMEGRVIEKIHKKLERSGSAPKRKKEYVLKKKGKLVCEACGFNFEKVYGTLGEGFAECHHQVVLSSLGGVAATRLSDLAIVCSNCHKMLHRKRPWMTIDELRRIIPDEFKH